MTKQTPKANWKFDGDKLREAREAAELTQKELAEAMGMPANQQGNISRWEQDVIPAAASLKALAEALKERLPDWGISMDYFLVPDVPDDEES